MHLPAPLYRAVVPPDSSNRTPPCNPATHVLRYRDVEKMVPAPYHCEDLYLNICSLVLAYDVSTPPRHARASAVNLVVGLYRIKYCACSKAFILQYTSVYDAFPSLWSSHAMKS